MTYYFCNGVFIVCVTILVTQSEQGILPAVKRYGHSVVRNPNDSPIRFYNRHEVQTPNQNMKYRKLSLEALKHYKPLLKYDARGRHIITKPVMDDDRKLNTMLNKVVKYKTEDELQDGLRTNIKDIFSADDIEQMERIAQELNWDHPHLRSDDVQKSAMPKKLVYNFDELVV